NSRRESFRFRMTLIPAAVYLLNSITSLAREQPGGNSVDLSATSHCRLAHTNELQMSGHARLILGIRSKTTPMKGSANNQPSVDCDSATNSNQTRTQVHALFSSGGVQE